MKNYSAMEKKPSFSFIDFLVLEAKDPLDEGAVGETTVTTLDPPCHGMEAETEHHLQDQRIFFKD